jgi:RNA polymerase sigma factor (sigma-70 family)
MAIDFDNHQRPGWLAPVCEHNGQRNTTIADIDLKQRRRLPSEGSLIEHMRGLSAFAMALTHNSFEADDLVQETYVRAVEAMGRLREESNIRAWLFTILRNVRLSQLRQQRARPKLVEVDRDENNAAALQTAEDPHAPTSTAAPAVLSLHHGRPAGTARDPHILIIMAGSKQALTLQRMTLSFTTPCRF